MRNNHTALRLPRNSAYFVEHLQVLGREVRDGVMGGMHTSTIEELAAATGEQGGDTIYRLDEHVEEVPLSYCSRWAEELPFLLVAEGLEGGARVFPADAHPDHLAWTMVVDPIDGTRGLMYGKRSAWALFGIAPPPRAGWLPSLADVTVALQAELPTLRAAVADVVWAARGEGAQGETHALRTGETRPVVLRPSRATTLKGGFAAICKFFPGTKVAAAELEERLFLELLGAPTTTSPQVFDDEYISSGGQLYELMVGHDRFVADLRPLLYRPSTGVRGLCCHPYDLCTWIIAHEAGVVVTDEYGGVPTAPLDTTSAVAWIGYANEMLQASIEPVLQPLLHEQRAARRWHTLIDPQGPGAIG